MRKSISFHGIQIIWFTYVELSNVFCTWKLILLIKILRIEGETAKNPPNTSHIPLHIYNKVAMWGFRETKRATYSINLTFPDKNIISVTAYIYVWHKFTFLAWRKNNMKKSTHETTHRNIHEKNMFTWTFMTLKSRIVNSAH